MVMGRPSSSKADGAGAGSDRAAAWRELFRRPPPAAPGSGSPQPLRVVAGVVPKELCGVYYKNGPVWDGSADEHPLDGEGFISAIRFTGDGSVTFQAQPVVTDHILAERREGCRVRPGAFGPSDAGPDVSVKNVGNTNVIAWGYDLLAFYEAGAPYVLDPRTLMTEDRYLHFRDGLPVTSGNAALDATMRMLGKFGDAVTAHPKIVAGAGVGAESGPVMVLTTVRYSLARGPKAKTEVTFWEIATEGVVVQRHTVTVRGFAYFHDFAVTDTRYVFFQTPMTVDWDAIPERGIARCLRQTLGEPTQIHSIARKDGAHTTVPFGGGDSFVFHHAYARETTHGRTEIVSVHYPEYNVPAATAACATASSGGSGGSGDVRGELRKLLIDWRESTVRVRKMARGQWLEFPVYDAAHHLVFATGEWSPEGGPQQAMVRVNATSGETQFWTRRDAMFGEPVVLAGTGADAGYVATMCRRITTGETTLLLWRVHRIAEGPIAEIALPAGTPLGLHGMWAADAPLTGAA